MLKFGLTRNKDSVILRSKIDKRNKRPPPLRISAPLSPWKIKQAPRALIRAFTVNSDSTYYTKCSCEVVGKISTKSHHGELTIITFFVIFAGIAIKLKIGGPTFQI